MANSSQLSTNAASERQYHDKRMVMADFNQAPFTIAWEITRACAFACVHCRADAIHQRDPNELTNLFGQMKHRKMVRQLTTKLRAYGRTHYDEHVQHPRILSWMDDVINGE